MSRGSLPPPAIMFWAVTDEVIERPDELERQFGEIRSAGFGGVAAFVRCSRYVWSDPDAQRTLARIGSLCRAHGLSCWLGPDPRFISRSVIRGLHGLPVVHCGDRSRADRVPNMAAVQDGRYSVRCVLAPRHGHMFHEVALEYTPSRVVRVLAIRETRGAAGRGDIVDLTRSARLFYNARDRYVEAFGEFNPPREGVWHVVAFFETESTHADFSDTAQMRRYHAALGRLRRAGVRLDGFMLDEPGFTCTYGSYPWSRSIHRSYRRATGRRLDSDVPKLLLDHNDNSHIRARVAYFRAVQNAMTEAQRGAYAAAMRLWGRNVHSGIHDTWHFESADMCDMNHGSLDLWASLKAKTGGFVDLGGVQELKDPESFAYANLAAMSVVAASLGKYSSGGYAFNNLWTVGDDEGDGWQTRTLDHCVNCMALFGTRWLAHMYGPAGTVGEERTFLGSIPLPGYPHHSTWSSFPEWNQRLSAYVQTAQGRLPASRLLLVFPIETLYALGDARADAVAKDVFLLILRLLDAHHHVDVLSPAMVASGRWNTRGLRVGRHEYSAVVYPHPEVISGVLLPLLREGRHRVCFSVTAPRFTHTGAPVRNRGWEVERDTAGVIARLNSVAGLRPVEAPEGAWVTTTEIDGGTLVTLAPSRAGYTFGGSVGFGGRRVSVPESNSLVRVLFGQSDQILDPPHITFTGG